MTTQVYLSTGVPNLDDIMKGGIPRGSLTLIMGVPGSGKTTLASQIAFASAHAGRTVLILTALSESTNKLLEHLRDFAFFDPDLVGGRVQFLSLQSSLQNGLRATRDAVLQMARQIKADMVVLDGFRGMREVEHDPSAAREFLYDVGTALGTLGCTIIVTSETDPHDPAFYPETTTADVIVGLHYGLTGGRQQRFLEVVKARGSAPLPGLHALTLNDTGASVYPQFEERVAAAILGGEAQTQGAVRPDEARILEDALAGLSDWSEPPVAFDLPELDALLGGGFARDTCTMVAGSLGTGKTLLALHFALAGVRAGEHVVYLSFRESPSQLLRAAAPFTIGRELASALHPDGGLSMIWVPPIKVQPDIIADRLLSELDRKGASRLVIDSVAEIERAILRGTDPDRLEDYLAALLQALQSRNVTTFMVKETQRIGAATLDFSVDPLSVFAENVLLMQQVPYRGALHRVLSMLKVRYTAHDMALREFEIVVPDGIHVLAPFESETGVLQNVAADQEDQAHRMRNSTLPSEKIVPASGARRDEQP
ncbi:MAG: RAD55 family ATPase [Ktedonobacterales bacterium]